MKSNLILHFNKKLKFEIVNASAIIVYGKNKYFLINGISADLVKIIILMQSIDIDELKFYAGTKFPNETKIEQKINKLIKSLHSFDLLTIK